MVNIDLGAQRELKDWSLSRYACNVVIQNANPSKPCRFGRKLLRSPNAPQELADHAATKEDETRLLLRAEIEKHNKYLSGVGCKARQTIRELGGTIPESLPVAESIKKVESREKKRLKAEQKKCRCHRKGHRGLITLAPSLKDRAPSCSL